MRGGTGQGGGREILNRQQVRPPTSKSAPSAHGPLSVSHGNRTTLIGLMVMIRTGKANLISSSVRRMAIFKYREAV